MCTDYIALFVYLEVLDSEKSLARSRIGVARAFRPDVVLLNPCRRLNFLRFVACSQTLSKPLVAVLHLLRRTDWSVELRDQFARCPWVHGSQDGEQCENGNHVFCLPSGRYWNFKLAYTHSCDRAFRLPY